MLRQFVRHGLDAERIAALENARTATPAAFRLCPITISACLRAIAFRSVAKHGRSGSVTVTAGTRFALLRRGWRVNFRGHAAAENIDKYQRLRSHPGADSLAQYLDSLNRYRELPEETLVLPSHGLPFIGIHNRVAAQHAHHEERLWFWRMLCTEPRSAADLLATLFLANLTPTR